MTHLQETTEGGAAAREDHGLQEAAADWRQIEAAWQACWWLDAWRSPHRGPACELSRQARAAMREAGWDGDNDERTADAIREAMREKVAGVSVRSYWTQPGEPFEPGEVDLTLSGGGPATRVLCQLDAYGEPCDCRLQFQDWFTPWQDYGEADGDALDWFAGLAYSAAE